MKRISKSGLFVISILTGLFISGSVVGQNRDVSVIEFASKDQTQKVKSHSRSAIKLNPLLFLRGDIPVYFERNVTDKICVEVGAGITFHDYLTSLNYNMDTEHDLSYDERLGFSYRIGFRYYAADFSYEPYGFYFGASFRSQSYSSVLTELNDVKDLDDVIKVHNSDFRFEIGYVTTFEESVFIEPYIGLGVRNRKYDKITIDPSDPSIYQIENTSGIVPFFSAGVKIGFSF